MKRKLNQVFYGFGKFMCSKKYLKIKFVRPEILLKGLSPEKQWAFVLRQLFSVFRLILLFQKSNFISGFQIVDSLLLCKQMFYCFLLRSKEGSNYVDGLHLVNFSLLFIIQQVLRDCVSRDDVCVQYLQIVRQFNSSNNIRQ